MSEFTPEPVCRDCRFFFRIDPDVCRRYPPQLIGQREKSHIWHQWGFAITRPNDWCGEWQAKQPETKP